MINCNIAKILWTLQRSGAHIYFFDNFSILIPSYSYLAFSRHFLAPIQHIFILPFTTLDNLTISESLLTWHLYVYQILKYPKVEVTSSSVWCNIKIKSIYFHSFSFQHIGSESHNVFIFFPRMLIPKKCFLVLLF